MALLCGGKKQGAKRERIFWTYKKEEKEFCHKKKKHLECFPLSEAESQSSLWESSLHRHCHWMEFLAGELGSVLEGFGGKKFSSRCSWIGAYSLGTFGFFFLHPQI